MVSELARKAAQEILDKHWMGEMGVPKLAIEEYATIIDQAIAENRSDKVAEAVAAEREACAATLCGFCEKGIPVQYLHEAFRHHLIGNETPWVVCRANLMRTNRSQSAQ